jgi:hypothetical protein
MTRPLTPVNPPYVVPVAHSFASRARAYAVMFLVLDAAMAFGMYKVIMWGHDISASKTIPWKAIAFCGAIVAAVAAFAIWRLQQAARAVKVARRAVDDSLRFAFDTGKVGEVGPDGAIIKDMSFPITAEQFTHFLSMPRPQLAFQAPLPPARVNR